MPVYFSPISDIILSAQSIAMLLSGVLCLAISREKIPSRPMPFFRPMGIALIILAIREWFGVICISNPDFRGFYTVAAVMQMAAAVPLLLAARDEAGTSRVLRKVVRLAFALCLAFIVVILAEPLFRHDSRILPHQAVISTNLFFLVKAFFCLAALLFHLSAARSDAPLPRGSRTIFGLFALYSAIVLVCLPPGIPLKQSDFGSAISHLMSGVYVVRILAAYSLAALLWNLYAHVIGVTGQIRWWPFAIILFMISIGFLFVGVSHANYKKVVHNNLVDAALNAARIIPLDALVEASAVQHRIYHADFADRIFGQARKLNFIVGCTRVSVRVDALSVDPDTDTVYALFDTTVHHSGGLWAATPLTMREIWDRVREKGVVVERRDEIDLSPSLAVAAVRDATNRPGGAAMLTLSSTDLALDSYVFRRLILLFLPVAVFILLLLLSDHQRAWLSAHSGNRLEALKLGALGNDLAGVLITRDRVIVQANRRVCDMSGVAEERLVGKNVRAVFNGGAFDIGENGDAVDREIRENGSFQYEDSLRNERGELLHVLVYVRKLSRDPADDHLIWEAVDITRQKKMERQMRDSRDQLQFIVDLLPEPIFVKDSQHRYQIVNRAFAARFGFSSPDDIAGKTMAEIKPEEGESSLLHDEIAHDMRGGTLVYERAVNFNGETRFLEISKTMKERSDAPGDFIILGVMHDFTSRKKSGDALEAERHFLMQFINTLPVIVCFLDRDRVIRLCDRDFAREAGADDPADLLGKPYDEVNPFGTRTEDDRRMLEQGGGFSDCEFELTGDGRTRNFILRRIVMSSADGEVLGLVKAFWDTTALVAANHAAKKAERAKAAFLANMSHELRTPMNGIVGMADLIIQSTDADAVRRLYAETIIKSAKTLQMVMDEVMDVATMDDADKRLSLANAPFAPLSVACEAAEIAGRLVEAWDVELDFEYDHRLASSYIGDARRIRQIIVQVLTHCSQLTGDGRIALAVSRRKSGDGAALCVSFAPRADVDSGSLEKVFKQRRNGDAPDGSPDSGVFSDRIGLPLAWRLVQSMRGELKVRVEDGKIVCRVELPLEEDPEAPARLRVPDMRGVRILLATADGERARAIEGCLDPTGAETTRVRTENGGEAALASIRDGMAHCDILVFDSTFLTRRQLARLLDELAARTGPNAIGTLMIVRPREAQEMGEEGNKTTCMTIPPLIPTELWAKIGGMAGRLPEGCAPAGHDKSPPPSVPSPNGAAQFPVDVLLVEDNTVNQMVQTGLLKRLGCRPVIARNGKEAMEMIARGDRFRIILMDCMMPVMDGYEATGRIRMFERSGGGERNTIVALTANTVAGDREKCLASGMDDYLTKPVTLEMFRDTLLKHCPEDAVLPNEGEEK